ncbi:MAG: hypothetical protein VB084_14285 [Syntrophomonadaceae bacterium]|nr:hypothetical protein [Syntrophomonadaceae bacterium]
MELQRTSEILSIPDVLANKIGTEAMAAKVTHPMCSDPGQELI